MKVSRGKLTLHATLRMLASAMECCALLCSSMSRRLPDRLPTLLGVCWAAGASSVSDCAQGVVQGTSTEWQGEVGHWSFTAKLGAFGSSLFGHPILGAETQNQT